MLHIESYLGYRVEIDVDDAIQVPCDNFGDFKEIFEIKFPLRGDETIESN